MFDDCKFSIFYHSDKQLEKLFSLSDFILIRSRISRITGYEIRIYEFRNLRVKIIPAIKLFIAENSMHKFGRGNNYDDFTYSELLSTCLWWSEILETDLSDIRVERLEFSLIIETSMPPEKYFSRFISLRTKPFWYLPPPYGFQRPLLKYARFSYYRVKFYDAGAWNRIPVKNLLKFEIQFPKMQRIKALIGKKEITFEDLVSKPFIRRLADFSLQTYHNIDKTPWMDLSNLKPQIRNFIYAGNNPDYWIMEKAINRHSAKKKRTQYRSLTKQLGTRSGGPYAELKTKFESKFQYLINN